MIIWNGWGFLVAVFFFVLDLAANLLTNGITGSEMYWDQHLWPLGVASIAAGILSWYVGRFLAKRKARILIDKQTGKEVVIESKHTLFFIKMYWWGPILGIIGLIIIVIGLF